MPTWQHVIDGDTFIGGEMEFVNKTGMDMDSPLAMMSGVVYRGTITEIIPAGVDETMVRVTVERVAMMNLGENISWCNAPETVSNEFFFVDLGVLSPLQDIGGGRVFQMMQANDLMNEGSSYAFQLTLFPEGGSKLNWDNVSDDTYPVDKLPSESAIML